MKHSGYQISLYKGDQISEVVALLGENLWEASYERNTSYFRWKYHRNPYATQLMGVVAIFEGRIVGFRGYFATNWYVGNMDNKTAILVPGDTVVHSDHRRRELSVAMGNLAMERFASRYSILLNTTAGKNSIPGYLRMGFFPLRKKAHYRKSTLARDVKVIVKDALGKRKESGNLPIEKSNISFGDFGDIEVSKEPRPEDMVRVLSSAQQASARITLLQDEKFFRWRFANPKGKYVFYFSRSGDATLGYLVMRVSDDSRQGFIVDYGQTDDGQIGRILDHIVGREEFDELNILNISVDESLWQTLKARRFERWGLHRSLKKWVYGERPLLVRPVKQQCSEADWFFGGLDIRHMANWHFKHICQDDA